MAGVLKMGSVVVCQWWSGEVYPRRAAQTCPEVPGWEPQSSRQTVRWYHDPRVPSGAHQCPNPCDPLHQSPPASCPVAIWDVCIFLVWKTVQKPRICSDLSPALCCAVTKSTCLHLAFAFIKPATSFSPQDLTWSWIMLGGKRSTGLPVCFSLGADPSTSPSSHPSSRTLTGWGLLMAWWRQLLHWLPVSSR